MDNLENTNVMETTENTPLDGNVEQVEQQQQENTEPNTTQQEETKERTFTQAELDAIIQKRLDRERKSIESDPRVGFVQRMAERYGMTPEQYLEAVREAEEQEQVAQLVQKGIPDELAQEVLEGRKFRSEYKALEQEKASRDREQLEYSEFIQKFPDIKPESIPQEVWQAFHSGKPLVDAYIQHDYNNLKAQVNANNINTKNANASTGGVTGQGSPDNAEFFTLDQLKSMTEAEVVKHYDKAMKSYEHWANRGK